ncbi:MAG: hypothetical protein AB7S72_07635 [Draconibacterium sp.]
MNLKTIILVFTAIFLLGFKTEKTKLNGTFKILSEEIVRNGESTITINNDKNNGLKTWSDKYFMFVNSSTIGTQVSSSFGGGTYELSGNAYTENIEHHVSPNFRGITLKLHLEIKGDTVIQIYPCDDSFYYDKSNCVIQKYVRVD